ncbi:Oidioi.mRNA.OKI2018_I69.PAR.g8809.t1.cds [Oikopleura dioica]|uniref:Oidioi.mRNA.OKI2018_I69.PAR.g8809.t1.cds n=1 Tax=Oikopleura dioica TaxID=34765 RepID=A0ABN7RIS1_OIKDI|nr:Oidioi.mRNA.OKI2018_I69.PAR.g8809.t1.cds [Oikopleura dioica]
MFFWPVSMVLISILADFGCIIVTERRTAYWSFGDHYCIKKAHYWKSLTHAFGVLAGIACLVCLVIFEVLESWMLGLIIYFIVSCLFLFIYEFIKLRVRFSRRKRIIMNLKRHEQCLKLEKEVKRVKEEKIREKEEGICLESELAWLEMEDVIRSCQPWNVLERTSVRLRKEANELEIDADKYLGKVEERPTQSNFCGVYRIPG